MKRYITLLLIFFIGRVQSNAQAYMQIGAGYSTLNHPTAELAAGYNAGPVFVQGGYLAHVSRDVEAGASINGRLGSRVIRRGGGTDGTWMVEPSVGYAYTLRSTDKKCLNTSGIIGSLYVGKEINQGVLLLGGNYTEKTFIISLAIRYNF